MQVFKRRGDFGCIKPRVFLSHTFVGPRLQSPEELSATTVFHTQIQIIFRLKGMIQRDDEWVIAGGQDFLLGQRPFYLVALDHLLFAEHCPLSA